MGTTPKTVIQGISPKAQTSMENGSLFVRHLWPFSLLQYRVEEERLTQIAPQLRNITVSPNMWGVVHHSESQLELLLPLLENQRPLFTFDYFAVLNIGRVTVQTRPISLEFRCLIEAFEPSGYIVPQAYDTFDNTYANWHSKMRSIEAESTRFDTLFLTIDGKSPDHAGWLRVCRLLNFGKVVSNQLSPLISIHRSINLYIPKSHTDAIIQGQSSGTGHSIPDVPDALLTNYLAGSTNSSTAFKVLHLWQLIESLAEEVAAQELAGSLKGLLNSNSHDKHDSVSFKSVKKLIERSSQQADKVRALFERYYSVRELSNLIRVHFKRLKGRLEFEGGLKVDYDLTSQSFPSLSHSLAKVLYKIRNGLVHSAEDEEQILFESDKNEELLIPWTLVIHEFLFSALWQRYSAPDRQDTR
ncbi:hypothetical protein IT575_00150 [bacterium]|nr:hypothetical protein [bacterium]